MLYFDWWNIGTRWQRHRNVVLFHKIRKQRICYSNTYIHRDMATSPLSYITLLVDIRPSVQQHFHNGEMPIIRGQDKGRPSILHHIDRHGYSPPPPHTHTGYSTGGYRSYRRWVSRSWRPWGTGPSEANGDVDHLIVRKWKIWKLWNDGNIISLEQWLMISDKKMQWKYQMEVQVQISWPN